MSILFLIGSVILALNEHEVVAGILGGGTLASIVTVFITGRKNKKNSKASYENDTISTLTEKIKQLETQLKK